MLCQRLIEEEIELQKWGRELYKLFFLWTADAHAENEVAIVIGT